MLRSSRSTTEDRHNRIMATIPPASPLSTSPNDCCSLKAPRGTAEATEVMSANTPQRFYPHHSLDTAVCVFVSLPGCPLCRTSMSTEVETSSPDSSSLATTCRKSSVHIEQTLVLWCVLQSLCPAVFQNNTNNYSLNLYSAFQKTQGCLTDKTKHRTPESSLKTRDFTSGDQRLQETGEGNHHHPLFWVHFPGTAGLDWILSMAFFHWEWSMGISRLMPSAFMSADTVICQVFSGRRMGFAPSKFIDITSFTRSFWKGKWKKILLCWCGTVAQWRSVYSLTHLKYMSVKCMQIVSPGNQDPSLGDLVQSGRRVERIVDTGILALWLDSSDWTAWFRRCHTA